MVKNYVWNEMTTMFMIQRIENIEKMYGLSHIINSSYLNKVLTSFKYIYIDSSTNENNETVYEIHSSASEAAKDGCLLGCLLPKWKAYKAVNKRQPLDFIDW